MRNRDQQKKPNWVGLAVVFLLLAPEVTIPIGLCAGFGYLIYSIIKNSGVTNAGKKTTYVKKQASFDDCPKKLFCFHKDKGEHHVARGKEIDPWDRPDIDISKYQRKG